MDEFNSLIFHLYSDDSKSNGYQMRCSTLINGHQIDVNNIMHLSQEPSDIVSYRNVSHALLISRAARCTEKYRCFEVRNVRFGFRFGNSGFRFGSYFTLRIQKHNGGSGQIIFPLRLAIVNVNYETFTATS